MYLAMVELSGFTYLERWHVESVLNTHLPYSLTQIRLVLNLCSTFENEDTHLPSDPNSRAK